MNLYFLSFLSFAMLMTLFLYFHVIILITLYLNLCDIIKYLCVRTCVCEHMLACKVRENKS